MEGYGVSGYGPVTAKKTQKSSGTAKQAKPKTASAKKSTATKTVAGKSSKPAAKKKG